MVAVVVPRAVVDISEAEVVDTRAEVEAVVTPVAEAIRVEAAATVVIAKQQVDVNEVKTRGGKGVLNSTLFLFRERCGGFEVSKFRSFNVSRFQPGWVRALKL
jgi:hypothetical protein